MAVYAGATFTRPGRVATLDHKILNMETMSGGSRAFDRGTYGDDSMKYHAVVVSALCQLCKVLAGLPNGKHAGDCRCARDRGKGDDVREERGPNKALVGCYPDSFRGLLILARA